MIPELDAADFVSFLEDLWNERGWDTTVQERSNGTSFIIGERGDGKRGVLFVFPTPESHVTGQHLRRFVTLCRKKGVDVGVVATQGAFDDEARQVAEAKGIHLLTRDTLAGTVEEGGFQRVLDRYTDTGGPFDALLARLHALGLPVPESLSLPVSLPADVDPSALTGRLRPGEDGDGDGGGASGDAGEVERGDPGEGERRGAEDGRLPSVPVTRALPVVVLAAVLFVAGAVVGPTLGLAGLVGGGSGQGDAVAVSAVSTAGANATLEAQWNARTTDSVTVNGTVYEAPPNETFVVVRFNTTNWADSPATLPQDRLVLDVAGERYGHQPLRNATGFAMGGLYAPNETHEAWTVYSVPEDAQSGTLLLLGEGDGETVGVRFVRNRSIAAEATELS
jgi:hypothetical protein